MTSVLMVLDGTHFNARPAWDVQVVVDGNLIMGRNQKSTGAAANAVLERLRFGARQRHDHNNTG